MRNLVVINQSSGYLTVDIVNALASSGKYKDIVLMFGHLNNSVRPLDPTVKLSRIIPYDRSSTAKRLFTWCWGTLQILFKLLTRFRGYYVMYVTNPPMSYLCSLIVKNSFSVIIFDLYPDALRNIGIHEGDFIAKWWSKRNRKLFASAEHVYTLSVSMASAVAEYVDVNKIVVTPLWPMSVGLHPIDKAANTFAIKHSLQDKFVVMYSGNMGMTHSVDVLVEVASRLKSVDSIHFLFVGGGAKKAAISERIDTEKLTNCTLLDWQPVDVLPQSLACADLAVVTLNEESAKVSVPSKTFNMMAVGAPLLCISPCESEIHRLVGKYKNGECFSPEDIDGIKSYIEKLVNDEALRSEYAANSYSASKDFTIANAGLYVK